MNYWLMKSEPDVFSIEDLRQKKNKIEHWDGVRNYQARNFMKEMKKGDLVLFYHSSCDDVGVAGICEIANEAYPDHTQWDKKSKYYDEKATQEKPRWFMIDVKWQKTFATVISLATLKEVTQLKEMRLLQKGNRLSVMPVTKKEFDQIIKMAK